MKMNKFFMGLGAIAALSLAACSNNDEPNAPEPTPSGDAETKYMAVTITTASEAAPISRADYEHGLEAESAVKTLDFYFFDADGNPTNVKAGNTNHLSVKESDIVTDGPESENVTKTIKAILVISTKDGDQVPSKILAVVNDKTEYKDLSVTQLQEKLTEGTTEIDGTDYFVMTNSVHLEAGSEVIATPVAGHLFQTEAAAKASPVTIYVERTLGKVRLSTTLAAVNDQENTFDPQDDKNYDGKKIFVKFLGWNVTTVSDKNRLVKDINPAWVANDWVWNSADYHRSFWAFNAPNNTYKYYDLNNDGELAADYKKAFDGSDYTYLKENAANTYNTGKGPQYPSKVIIAAQLVDETGAPMEFAEWAGQRMTQEDLKIALADALSLYTGDPYVEGETFTRTKVTPDDLVLKTAVEAGYVSADKPTESGRYLVYAALTPAANAKDWYASTETGAPILTDAEVKAAFKALGGAKIWAEGLAYYYFDIKHLGTAASFGANGVVRNHVYDAAVTSLKGLGTPVYNPDEMIIPEKPKDDNTFIAAEIKVLSWRVVSFNVGLEW